MFIKPTRMAADLTDEIRDEALLYTASEDVPCPWDADITLEGNNVVLTGGLLPGGSSSKGICVCTVPIEEFSKFYKLEVPDDSDIEEIGWERA